MPAGACLLVVGASGSGKSSLGLAIAGLVPRDIPGTVEGLLSVAGVDPRVAPRGEVARRVGLVFQDPGSQLVMERVEDDVAFGLENRAWAQDAMSVRVPEAIAEAGLGGLERRRTNRLSGGQQQRLALAGVLAARPEILVLDEPTANLDPRGAAGVFERLRALRAEHAATIVLIEHHVDAAWPLADLVLALGQDGTPIDAGTPDEVLRRSGERMAASGIWLPAGAAPSTRPFESVTPVTPVAPDTQGSRGGSTRTAAARVATASSVSFEYERGAPVVRAIDLALVAGERVALVGANGSGKSTLGRLLVGLLRPTRGGVRLGEDDPAGLPAKDLARRAGYVFQDPEAGFLTDSVADEVMLGLDGDERAAAPSLMARLRLPLETFGPRSPYRLSGGEARRLSLACTLVRRPGLLVLDEPTFGQDRLGYDGLLEILRERLEDGVCLVAATHDRRLVADLASRIVELEAGRIIRDAVAGRVAA